MCCMRRVHAAVLAEGPRAHAHGRGALPVRGVRQEVQEQLQPAPAPAPPQRAQALRVRALSADLLCQRLSYIIETTRN